MVLNQTCKLFINKWAKNKVVSPRIELGSSV